MSQLQTQDHTLTEFMAMPDDEHLKSIGSMAVDISTRLLRMGKAVYAWKLKGRNLDELGMNGMTHWLLLIGGDELYAPLLAKTMRDKKLTVKLSRLSFTEQKLIGDGGMADLLLLSADGKEDILQVSPVSIQDPEQLNQLLGTENGRSKIRSVAEQRQWIEANRAKSAKPIPQRIGNCAPDPERDGSVFLGKHGDFISADTHLACYRACRKKEAGR